MQTGIFNEIPVMLYEKSIIQVRILVQFLQTLLFV